MPAGAILVNDLQNDPPRATRAGRDRHWRHLNGDVQNAELRDSGYTQETCACTRKADRVHAHLAYCERCVYMRKIASGALRTDFRRFLPKRGQND